MGVDRALVWALNLHMHSHICTHLPRRYHDQGLEVEVPVLPLAEGRELHPSPEVSSDD